MDSNIPTRGDTSCLSFQSHVSIVCVLFVHSGRFLRLSDAGFVSKLYQKEPVTIVLSIQAMSNVPKESAESKDEVKEASLELFPEREGKKKGVGPVDNFLYGDPVRQKLQCEKNVMKAIEEAPMVKLMIAALKSNGW